MRILIADDDLLVCELLREYVTACDHEVVETVSSGGAATIQSYNRHAPDLVLLDVLMPRCDGLLVCSNVLSRHPNAKIVLMSGQVQEDSQEVKNSGAVAYLHKPFNLDELRGVLDSLAA
ncbi:MAG TPA: response regulator [Chthoniobacteraceae bacterium]|jgi:CheY-like chemotaxis protein